MSSSLWSDGLWPTRLPCPWDSPGKNTGEGCHSLLQGLCWPRGWTQASCTEGRFITVWATRKVQYRGKWFGGITLSWKINTICQPSNILFHHHFWVILSEWKLPAILVDRNTSSGLWSLTWVNSRTPRLEDCRRACLSDGAPSPVRVKYGY